MSQCPISPTYSSGAALQRTAARPVRPSVSRRNSSSASCTEIAYVPLPPDVDPAFMFIVRTLTKPADVGIRLMDCMAADFVRAVKHADVKIDVQKMFPEGKVVVQRGYFPGESSPPSLEVDVNTDGASAFTWGDLLSLIVRQQHQPTIQDESPGAAEGELWANGLPPYEQIWVVAIRRSTGASGVVRYFPELEVRVPFTQLREGS
ncbi:hypothetical protein C8T65DRAFT_739479 [Cerioporus squamosus]|nr:hypothetical protein C8T65DRAFT_739479 [Cerioporus squamosus]